MFASRFGMHRKAAAAGGGLATDVLTTEGDDAFGLEDASGYLLGNSVTGSPRISQLSASSAGAVANEFPLVQSSATKKGTLAQLRTLADTSGAALWTHVDTQGTGAALNSPAVTKPTGTTSGDLLVYALSTTNVTPDAAGPEGGGWTILYNVDIATSDYCGLAYKIAGSSEAASYTWTTTGSSASTAAVVSCFRGVDTLIDMCSMRNVVGYRPSVIAVPGALVLGIMHSTQTVLSYDSNDTDMTLARAQNGGTATAAIYYSNARYNGGSGGAMARYLNKDNVTYRMATGVSFQ